MTKADDELWERRIAAARALPEAEGVEQWAEYLAGRGLSLAHIADRLRERKARHAEDWAAHQAKTQQAARGRAAAQVVPTAPKPKPAFYSVADAKETVFLCQIARAPELGANFIAAKTPIVKVREALAQRADQVLAQRAKEAVALNARKKAVTAQWDDAVAKVNAENAGSSQ
jgi:hypothetical protein